MQVGLIYVRVLDRVRNAGVPPRAAERKGGGQLGRFALGPTLWRAPLFGGPHCQ